MSQLGTAREGFAFGRCKGAWSLCHALHGSVLSGSWLLNASVTAGTEEPNPARGEATEPGLCIWSLQGRRGAKELHCSEQDPLETPPARGNVEGSRFSHESIFCRVSSFSSRMRNFDLCLSRCCRHFSKTLGLLLPTWCRATSTPSCRRGDPLSPSSGFRNGGLCAGFSRTAFTHQGLHTGFYTPEFTHQVLHTRVYTADFVFSQKRCRNTLTNVLQSEDGSPRQGSRESFARDQEKAAQDDQDIGFL